MSRLRTRITATVTAALALGVAASLASPGAGAATTAKADDPLAITATGPEPFTEGANGLPDVDTRGTLTPTSAQKSAVPTGATVRWNRFGTPSSIIDDTGFLSAAKSGAPATIARSWLSTHKAVFGLSAAQVADLDVLNDSTLSQSKAHVVRFRQEIGNQAPATDGMVTVGVDGTGRVAYVSSSLSKTTSAAPAATLTPVTAWGKALSDLRADNAPSLPAVSADDLTSASTKVVNGWTTFKVPGLAQTQQVRLRALVLPGKGSRPVFESNVVNAGSGASAAYTSLVDGVTGQVLVRRNRTDNLASLPHMTNTSQPFEGTVTATSCGPDHAYSVDAATKTIIVTASGVVPTDDIVVRLFKAGDATPVATSADVATSPEALTYSPAGGVPAGDYVVRVCPFDTPTVPVVVGPYAGTFIASEQAAPSTPSTYPPEWKYFVANPALGSTDPAVTTDNRQVVCWEKAAGCSTPPTPLQNTAARAPWDVDPRTGVSTNTTLGNAAFTGEAWISPLTPGGAHQMPLSLNRHYGFDNTGQDFTDAWNNTRCSPTAFTPVNNNNDILASVTNLFSGHNRFHDFSYYLGFTEGNYNLQQSNFGNAQHEPGTLPGENDPEIGNVQAGAVSAGAPTYMGRDNANQIALQDGVPGITNQYLFQPIAGAFYAPCTDGDLDAPVYGHEYTHAISNRMIGGPDDGITGLQGGSMGESWSDQVALEYLFEHSYDIGAASPWVEGPYVTGNKVTGIRNYALDKNPLQYGDIGYDTTGAEVHADGEVWSATMFNVRRQLVAKYNKSYPESNKSLELRCADAASPSSPLPVTQCPGGRRWLQLTFDSFLMQEGSTSMLDARDAYLGADKLRFGGANQTEIWKGFAQTGMGGNAFTNGTDDEDPKGDYTSPVSTSEGTLSFTANSYGTGTSPKPVTGKLYVGDYEARATPLGTGSKITVKMVPGDYRFTFAAPGFGIRRFTGTIAAGKTFARDLHVVRNVASKTNGASIDGASPGSLNTTGLIDDTESTNWAGVNTAASVDASEADHPFVNVRLAGGKQVIRQVVVSSLLRPVVDGDADQSSNARFTALRQFAIETCTDSTTADCSSTLPSSAPGSPYKRIYTSPADAFNGVNPRPLAPTQLAKTFDIPDTQADHVRLVALENQCTGQASYAGEQDDDPLNDTDCKAATDSDLSVRAAELEVVGYDSVTRPPGDPVVAMTMTGKEVAKPGDTLTYTLSYRNLGPKAASNSDVRITSLPTSLRFVKASNGGVFDSTSRALRWKLGTVPVGQTKTLTLTTTVAPDAQLGDTILTQAQFAGTDTYSLPAAAVTVVGP